LLGKTISIIPHPKISAGRGPVLAQGELEQTVRLCSISGNFTSLNIKFEFCSVKQQSRHNCAINISTSQHTYIRIIGRLLRGNHSVKQK